MYRQQPPLPRSPEKFRRSSPPPLTPNGQFEGHTQWQEPKSQVVNGGVSSYQPSFQERGQRQSERHRPTPSAFQTHQNADGNYAEEGALERLPLRESSNFDNQEQPTAPRENPPIGGLYVFDDSKHDKIKRQIYETKKKDYAEYLQRKVCRILMLWHKVKSSSIVITKIYFLHIFISEINNTQKYFSSWYCFTSELQGCGTCLAHYFSYDIFMITMN